MSTQKTDSEGEPLPLEPARREHGVSGYTDRPVGGFGEDYRYQVAQGAEPEPEQDLPADPNDASLRHVVQKALARAHIDAADLRVDVQGARVTLYGTVQHAFEKSDLEARVRAVPGVAGLTSRVTALHVEPTPR
jgi:hypothetical protein